MGRIIVLGAGGLLGSAVAKAARQAGHEVDARDRRAFDVTDPMAAAALAQGSFDVCVNCAAYTNVDLAEREREAAMDANGVGPGLVAQACALAGTRMIHISTDFVFDGRADRPYREDDPVNPLSWYGRTKLEGEDAALQRGACVVRTAWLYGHGGPSFPAAILAAFQAGKPLRVVTDHTGAPTYAEDLAGALLELIERGAPAGLWHAAGPTVCTRFEWAAATLAAWRAIHPEMPAPELTPIRSADWPAPAKRPAMSALDCGKLAALGVRPMRPLCEAMAAYVAMLAERP
jgi:dTDP-4-dehydrorhamnose reductase